MRFVCRVAVIGVALAVAACAPPPEKSIAKDCVRLNLLGEVTGGGDQKKACACFGDKLKADLSEDNLKALAKALKASKNDGDIDGPVREAGLNEMTQLSLVGAAKSCASS